MKGSICQPCPTMVRPLGAMQSFAVALLSAMTLAANAATYEVSVGGLLQSVLGSHWDAAVQPGTPFFMSLRYATPPSATYNFNGYSTHTYLDGNASMSCQVGTNLFTAGRVDLTVWNDMLYDGTRIDGYLLGAYEGSGPGFDQVNFNIALQTLDTNLLADVNLPLSAVPLAAFDKLALAAVQANFTGYGWPENQGHLSGAITSFTITEVPEPSTTLLAVTGMLAFICQFVARRNPKRDSPAGPLNPTTRGK